MAVATRPLLEVQNLTVQFRTDSGWLTAVDDVSFDVGENECVGIVGESGSGKSVSALSILRLHAAASTRMGAGRILYGGRDLLTVPNREFRRMRGKEIAMIFQDSMSSLNPVLRICDQIEETLQLHQGLSGDAARRRAVELLEMVRIPDAVHRARDYPHRLSGGMRQRVMIAIAIACRPRLLIADEPTTALDVTVQDQILELLRDLRKELGMSVILISHDLGVIAEMAERVMVMYAGKIVESGPVGRIFARSTHPYTEGLLASVPSIDRDLRRLPAIRGSIPDPLQAIPGCRFNTRCGLVRADCLTSVPQLAPVEFAHQVRCPPRVEAAP